MSRAAGPSTESGGGLAESLIDCSPCPAAAVAADGRLLLANPAFRARFGDGDRLPLADAALARLVRRAGEGGGPVEAEVGGAPVTLRVHPLSGDRIAVFGPAPPDPGAELFRAMADHAPDPVMVVDERFAAVYVSPSLQRVVGYEPAEFGLGVRLDLIHPDDRDRAAPLVERVLAGEVVGDRLRFRHADGHHVWLDVTASPVPGPEGSVARAVISARDVTALVEGQQVLDAVAGNVADMLVLDRGGAAHYVSPGVRTLLGREPEELRGLLRADLIHPDDAPAFMTMLAAAEAGGYPAEERVRALHADGHWVPLDVLIAPIPDGRGGVEGAVGSFRDATARVQAEQEAREREGRFRAMAENTSDMVIFSDATLSPRYCSPAVRRVLGREPEEFVGRWHEHLVHPDDMAAVREAVAAAVAGEHSPIFLVRVRHADGHWVWVGAATSPILDDEGTFAGVAGIFRDESGRVAAEEALRESEERFRAMADHASDLVVLADATGAARYVSPAARRLLGREPEEMIGPPRMDLIHPEDHAAYAEAAAAAASGGHPPPALLRARHADGRWIWTDAVVAPVVDEQGAVTALVGSFRDVSARVLAEEELRASEARYRLVVENASDVIIRHAPEDGSYRWLSPSVRQVLGREPADLVGENPLFFIHPDDQPVVIAAQAALAEGEPGRVRYRYRAPDGAWRWLESTARPIHDADGRLVEFVTISRDVHDEVVAQRALAESEARLRAVFDAAPVGMWETDLGGRVRLFNEAFLEVTGLTRRALVDDPLAWRGILHPEDAPDIAAVQERRRQTGETVHVQERLVRPDGSRRLVETHVAPIRDAQGEVRAQVGLTIDVTERVEAERALAAGEARLRALVDQAPVAVWEVSATGAPVYVNAEWRRLFGLAEDAPLPAPEEVVMAIAPGDRERFTRSWMDALTRRAAFREETGFSLADGSERHVLTTAAPVLDPDGGVSSYVGMIVDLTDRVRAEQELRTSEERFRALVESAPIGVWEVDATGRTVFLNAAWRRHLGLAADDPLPSPDDLIGLIAPADREGAARTWLAALGGGGPFSVEGAVVLPDGSVRHLATTGAPIPDRHGGVRAFVGMTVDLTDRVAAERALAASEERFRALVEGSPVGIWEVDADGRLQYVNPAWRGIYAFGPDAADDEIATWRDRLPEDEREERMARWEAARAGGRSYRSIGRLVLPGGEVRHVSVEALPMMAEDGRPRGWVGMVRDVTDRVAATAALAESEERYRLVAEHMSDVVARHSLDGTTEWVSPSSAEIAGVSRERMEGHSPFERIDPDDLPACIAAIEQALAGVPSRVTYRWRREDGHSMWFESSLRAFGAEGEVRGFISTSRDVTERIAGERALAESEARYRLLADVASDAILRLTPALDLLYASPAFDRMAGEGAGAALVGRPLTDLVHADDLAALTGALAGLPSGQTPPVRFRLAAGEADARWVELTLAAVRAGHGALSGVVGVMRDVSTQVEAEEALRASEERYRLLAENMSDVLWLGDPEGNVLYVSPSVERQLGWRPADIIGDPTWNLTGEGEPEFRRAYGAILDGGGPERVLMYAPTAGGGMTWVESSLSGIRGQDQEVTRVIGVTRDVRAQIEAEAALRSSEERYRLLADNVTDTIWLTDADADGRIRYVSPSVERLLGRRPEDLVGRPGTDLLGPDAEVAIAALQRMAERREAVRVRVHLRRADGGLVWIESESTPLFDPDGAIVQVVSVVRDVTAQVEVEQALEAERDRLGAILAAVQDGLLVAGPEGDLLFANDAFCRMAGRDRATVEGTDPPFPWAPAGAEAMWDLTAPGERAAELVGADGDVLRVIMAVAALPAGGSVATVKDVTAMVRRAEHDRDQAREREELVAVVSHELRSPLAALATLLGVVAEEPADRPPSERQQARIVAARRSADRLRRLAGDLTVLAQQDAGRFTLRRTDADLAELAGQLIAAATPEAARSGVTLRGDLRPCIAYVDPDRVAQVIDNLVANAVKFTPDGGTVTVRVRGDAERALIEVADQGPGLPAEERERVFERYYQAPSSTRVAPGSGLGLAIARSVVDAHHGTVGLHDGPGGLGLVARVTLPR